MRTAQEESGYLMDTENEDKSLIERIVTAALWHYLQLQLGRYPVEQHNWVTGEFSTIVGRITEHLHSGFFMAPQITVQAIKTLHRLQYPEGYRGMQNDMHGNPVAYLIPGEFKKYPNYFTETGGAVKYADVPPEAVGTTVDDLLERLNKGLTGPPKQRRDAIVWFCMDIASVHPFADANGRIAVLMLDTLLARFGFEPMYINLHKQRDTKGLYQVVSAAREQRCLQALYRYLDDNRQYLDTNLIV